MKKNILFFILPLLFIGSKAHAGWPIGKYHYIFAPSYSIYTANSGWDRRGRYFKSNGQKFVAQSIGLYAARGISRRLDISASVPVTYQSISNEFSSTNTVALGDLQFGGSYVLINSKYANYTSVYVGGILPLYTNTDTRILGLGNTGATVKLSNSGNITKKMFYNAEVGFAQYVGEGAPQQYLGTITVGYLLDKKNQIGADIGGVRSISDDKQLTLNTFANRDFDYLKISANYGHAITKRINVNVAGFYTIAGYNTGQGYGGALSLLLRLPNP
jgi:hypothetical protein